MGEGRCGTENKGTAWGKGPTRTTHWIYRTKAPGPDLSLPTEREDMLNKGNQL